MTTRKQTFLISALSVAIAVILLGYSAYGWMTMSKSVTAKTDIMTVSAPNGMEISKNGTDWGETVTLELREIVKKQIQQYNEENPGATLPAFVYDAEHPDAATNSSFFLLPASSYDGVSLWKNDRIIGAASETDTFTKANPVTWNAATSAYEGYYLDVPLWLRTSSTAGDNVYLQEAGTVIAGSAGTDAHDVGTVRVAILKDDATAFGATPYVFAQNSLTAEVVTNTDKATAEALPDGDFLKPPAYLNFVSGKSQSLFTLGSADYDLPDPYQNSKIQITVRIWVEGQDQYCVAKIGGKTFNISLCFTAE